MKSVLTYLLMGLATFSFAMNPLRTMPHRGALTPDPCVVDLANRIKGISEKPFTLATVGVDSIVSLSQWIGKGRYGSYFEIEGVFEGEPLIGSVVALYMPDKFAGGLAAIERKVKLAKSLAKLQVGPRVTGHFNHNGIFGIIYAGLGSTKQDFVAPLDWYTHRNAEAAFEKMGEVLIKEGLIPTYADFFVSGRGEVLLCDMDLQEVTTGINVRSGVTRFFGEKSTRWQYRTVRDGKKSQESISRNDLREDLDHLIELAKKLRADEQSIADKSKDDLSTQLGRTRLALYLADYLGDLVFGLLSIKEWSHIDELTIARRQSVSLAYSEVDMNGRRREKPLLDDDELDKIPRRSTREIDFLAYRFEALTRTPPPDPKVRNLIEFVLKYWDATHAAGVSYHPYFGQLVYALLQDFPEN